MVNFMSASAMRLMRLRQDGWPAVGPVGARLFVWLARASRAAHWAGVSSRLRRVNCLGVIDGLDGDGQVGGHGCVSFRGQFCDLAQVARQVAPAGLGLY